MRDEFIVCLPFGLGFGLAAAVLEDLTDFDDFDDFELFAYGNQDT